MTSLLSISHRLKLPAGRLRIKRQTSLDDFELVLVVIQITEGETALVTQARADAWC